eukprot:CCRYP_016444-RA/>CCRYP_016444-RA protein AED:0.41 eAED:0.38 QI:0/0/0/1/0/0/3/0/339
MNTAPTSKNYYAILDSDNYGILDSGATDIYLKDSAPLQNINYNHVPINVTIPNGKTMSSSASATVPIPQLPSGAVRIHHPRTQQEFNLGCTVRFSDHECIVTFNDIEVLRGKKNNKNGLFFYPARQAHNFAGGVHQSTTMEETVKFLHQCLFSPTVNTLCKAIDNGQLVGFPHLTSKMVRKYLPESTATAKDTSTEQRKGLRSTTKGISTSMQEQDIDFNPTQEDVDEVQLFIGATIGEQNPGTAYTDQTGNFPVRSFHGNRCQFVAYDYRSNAILVRALKDQTDASLLTAFQDVYAYLTKRGFRPRLNVMDNQCSKAIQQFIESSNAQIQLVNPTTTE